MVRNVVRFYMEVMEEGMFCFGIVEYDDFDEFYEFFVEEVEVLSEWFYINCEKGRIEMFEEVVVEFVDVVEGDVKFFIVEEYLMWDRFEVERILFF